jgi:hypothetical protein
MPSPLPDHTLNSSSSLAIMLSLFFISGRYVEILWLLWQLQSSTLFHLSIVSMMSLHSTGSYLETLHLLWHHLKLFEFSGRCNHSVSGITINLFWQLQREPLCTHPFGAFSLPEKNFTAGARESPFLSCDHEL